MEMIPNNYLLSIPASTHIRQNFRILHFSNIFIISRSIIGVRVTIAYGITMELIFEGKRKGCPEAMHVKHSID